MGKGMPRAHTAASSPAPVPAPHSSTLATQAAAEWIGAPRSQNSPSLHSPSLFPPVFTVVTSSLIPQTTYSRLCASLWETQTVCHSILECKVTIEITMQHGYFYFTCFQEDNPCRSGFLCKILFLVKRVPVRCWVHRDKGH